MIVGQKPPLMNKCKLPMNGMITILIWATVAIGVSFLCSIIEAVMLSITDAQVAAISERNPKLGYKWVELELLLLKPMVVEPLQLHR